MTDPLISRAFSLAQRALDRSRSEEERGEYIVEALRLLDRIGAA